MEQAWLDARLRARLTGFARRFVNDRHEAEDVAQEALLRACSSAASLRSPDRAEAWLFRICRHAAIDHVRWQRVRQHLSRPMPEDGEAWAAESDAAGPAAATPRTSPGARGGGEDERSEARLDLGRLPLDRLSAHQRLLLRLHYERGLSQAVLCRMTGLSASALRVRLFRARGALLASVQRPAGGSDGRSGAGRRLDGTHA